MLAKKEASKNTPLQEAIHHARLDAKGYFELLFDGGSFTALAEALVSVDPLQFVDTQPYIQRIKISQEATQLNDALRVAYGKMNNHDLVIACMDFDFIGGSMGIVVGDKMVRAIAYACTNKVPLLAISKSGGARMMEGAFSLMQMARISAKLIQLSAARVPYISLMTNPTMGGVTASFAMLGDINIAEPGALIGFAGPKVVQEAVSEQLPEDFQTAESLLKNGFLDFIVDRRILKAKLTTLLTMLQGKHKS